MVKKMYRNNILNILLVVTAILFILSFVLLPIIDSSSHWYVVTSGSMEPVLKTGDVLYISKVDADKIKAGEIITFYSNDRKITITHRCIEVLHQDNKTFFRTKGDANENNDTFLVPQNALVGRVPNAKIFGHAIYAKIPRLGYLSYFIHTKIGFFLLILLPGYLLIGMETYNIFNILQEDKKDEKKSDSL